MATTTFGDGYSAPSIFQRILRQIPVGAVLILLLVGSCSTIYSIPQTEVGYLTQGGRVLDANAGPIGAGYHLKLPFFQGVDTIRVTRDTDDLGEVSAITKDTQTITLRASVTTTVPASAAYHLLYEVGKSGNLDLKKNYDATILTELRNVMGRHSIGEIAGEGREGILGELQTATAAELKRLYGIQVDQVQVSVEKMPDSYVSRINQAMLSQAAILQAQRDKERSVIEAETAKITASGLANRAIEEARGRSESALLEAQASAKSTEMKGKAEADAKTAMASALSANASLVEYERALRWNGQLPQNIYAGAPIPFLTPTSK